MSMKNNGVHIYPKGSMVRNESSISKGTNRKYPHARTTTTKMISRRTTSVLVSFLLLGCYHPAPTTLGFTSLPSVPIIPARSSLLPYRSCALLHLSSHSEASSSSSSSCIGAVGNIGAGRPIVYDESYTGSSPSTARTSCALIWTATRRSRAPS